MVDLNDYLVALSTAPWIAIIWYYSILIQIDILNSTKRRVSYIRTFSVPSAVSHFVRFHGSELRIKQFWQALQRQRLVFGYIRREVIDLWMKISTPHVVPYTNCAWDEPTTRSGWLFWLGSSDCVATRAYLCVPLCLRGFHFARLIRSLENRLPHRLLLYVGYQTELLLWTIFPMVFW